MIDKVLRYPKEVTLKPIALRVLRPFHPTLITVIAFGVGIAAAVAVWQQAYLIGLGLWFLNRILDGLDGTVARLHNKQSDFGGYLDIVLDTVIYALIPTALAVGIHSTDVYLSLIFLLGSFYINGASWMYLSALLEKRQSGASAQGEMTTVTMPSGLIEGTETIIFFSLFLLFPNLLTILFVVMGVLVYISAMQRLVWAVRHL
ncbi:MAG: CDP-alcohol phosphatidyltransferase family protein [Chloroflexi bacterium AL-W]|nr:CDP-alcohol phosphatidyltransferase family protein [Chloroflexi bacterium AL-N1]NOK67451.1 CDP-alcohol phosphatidyltransferase family protein [Chloroflexi bacterium AL-N10]NOK75057.1 CDP-alcohol phosphatidyltransferase family protein [Chloroflexi bacterium AL-N5]NOK81844.1 CDP-alcohol phosphatidyltransferase family protein [Chloroflexi bacterium AL-W]NOK89690.1 CDP-alcohol phosphatidyltransferase family protein [Chloroflexi bacterium AL-N15]